MDKTNKRNRYGVKSSCDLYRTIRDEHYICWLSYPTNEQIEKYKEAGIKLARRGPELFIRAEDEGKALAVDLGIRN